MIRIFACQFKITCWSAFCFINIGLVSCFETWIKTIHLWWQSQSQNLQFIHQLSLLQPPHRIILLTLPQFSIKITQLQSPYLVVASSPLLHFLHRKKNSIQQQKVASSKYCTCFLSLNPYVKRAFSCLYYWHRQHTFYCLISCNQPQPTYTHCCCFKVN